MKFTDTQFVQAVELIQAVDARKKKRKDKRRAARTEIRVPVAIKIGVDSETGWTPAQLHDISPRGAKLEIASEMEEGSSFLLRLPAKHGTTNAVPLVCRVAHCVRQRGSFLIGAEFTGQLTPAQPLVDAAADLSRIQRSILD
jgi:hypothetical protein